MKRLTVDNDHRRHVLVADGDPYLGELAGVLEQLGYTIDRFRTGHEAESLFRRIGHGAVIGDWDVSGTCGRELPQTMRGNAPENYPYVIMLSGSTEQRQVEACIEAGADDLLAKPVEHGMLLARLRYAEYLTRLERDLSEKNEILARTNEQLERTHSRLNLDLKSAARVQQALLPSPKLSVPGMDIGWKLRPCTELAGDLLNCTRLDEHHMAFFVLDVSGHGVSSAMLSVQVSRVMAPNMTESELLKEKLDAPPWYCLVEPQRVLLKLNELFQTTGDMPQYFTIVYGLLNVESGHLRIATSGHPGPIHVPAQGKPEAIRGCSHPVGFFENPTVFEHEMTLARGDRIWLYTDGVTEAEDASGTELGTSNLIRLVEEQRDRPAREAVESVMEAVERWSQPGEVKDDCSLLAIGRE